MSQARLNHLMILHYHQDVTDKLDLKSVANEYITKNETRGAFLLPFFEYNVQIHCVLFWL